MATCYWNHDPQPSETYLCLDGKSQVCALCCVEKCAVDTPVWFANCAEAGHPTWPAVRARRTVAPKLVCLESYWNAELFILCGPEGEKFARDFLAASGCRAVIGYTTNVDWMQSLVADMLFLQRFYTDSDPWNNLAAIFESVKEDYRPAKTLGYTLLEAEDMSPQRYKKAPPTV